MQKIDRASALVLVTLLAACGGSPTTSPTVAAPVATVPATVAKPTQADQPVGTSAPATNAVSPTKSVPTPNVTAAAGPSNNADGAASGQLGTLGAGLDKLKSYSMSWTLAYDTKDDKGAAQTTGWTMQQDFINASKNLHMVWATNNTATNDKSRVEFFQLDDTFYSVNPTAADAKQQCFAIKSAEFSASKSILRPADFFGNLQNAKLLAKGETVNGVVTDHFQTGENSVSFAAGMTGAGDAWVAQQGGFVVKFTGKYAGKIGVGAAIFGAAAGDKTPDGQLTWNYSVDNIDKVPPITVPANCAKPGSGIPLPPNTLEKSDIGPITSFKTKDTPKNMVAFYTTQMLALGYTVETQSDIGEMSQLLFAKGDSKVSVIVVAQDGVTNVLITNQP